MTDTLPDGTQEPEEPPDAEALAAELDLGLDLSPEEQADADAMVARLRSQFGLDEPAVEKPAAETEPEEPEPVVAEEPAEPAPAPAASPDVVLIDGREVPVTEARSLIDLRNYLASHPDKAQEVRQVIEGKPAPEPEPAKPPEWLDQDDPAQMAMWTRQTELENQIRQIGNTQRQSIEEQTRARASADANAGIATFRAAHPELSEDDLTTLRTHAVALNIIDGLAKSRSGPDAILKALDIAYWDHPEFRARASETPTPTEAKAAKAADRKGKLNALGGSSGSAPRSEAKPDLSSDSSAKKEAAQWLRDQGIRQ
jgi:hypothetical protein